MAYGSVNVPGDLSGKQDRFTGLPGQVVGFNEAGAAAAVQGWSRRNWLVNWYFPNPVNSNGQTEYGAWGMTVDRWWNVDNPQGNKIILHDSGISIDVDAVDGPCLMQCFQPSMAKLLCGKTFTLTMLWSDGTINTGSAVFPSEGDQNIGICVDEAYAFAYFQYNQYSFGLPSVAMRLRSAGKILTAMKVELGSAQTLANQEGNGWVLSDLPNYPLQYALCKQYAQNSNVWTGYQHANRNLVPNWYLMDPVNQKGQTSYTEAGYTIDNWLNVNSGEGWSVRLDSDGIFLQGNPANGPIYYTNQFEHPLPKGTDYTVSILAENVTGSIHIGDSEYSTKIGNGLTTYSRACTSDNGISFITIIGENGASSSAKIKAVKLELGLQQTLAHLDTDGNWVLNEIPDKSEMLERCRRYFHRVTGVNDAWGSFGTGMVIPFPDGSLVLDFILPLTTPMRQIPAVSGATTITAANGLSAVDVQPIACVNASDTCVCIRASVPLPPDDAAAASWLKQGQAVILYAPPGSYIDLDANL